jgi:hypothetical protein
LQDLKVQAGGNGPFDEQTLLRGKVDRLKEAEKRVVFTERMTSRLLQAEKCCQRNKGGRKLRRKVALLRRQLCATTATKAMRLSRPKQLRNMDPTPGSSEWQKWRQWSEKAKAKLSEHRKKQEHSIAEIESTLRSWPEEKSVVEELHSPAAFSHLVHFKGRDYFAFAVAMGFGAVQCRASGGLSIVHSDVLGIVADFLAHKKWTLKHSWPQISKSPFFVEAVRHMRAPDGSARILSASSDPSGTVKMWNGVCGGGDLQHTFQVKSVFDSCRTLQFCVFGQLVFFSRCPLFVFSSLPNLDTRCKDLKFHVIPAPSHRPSFLSHSILSTAFGMQLSVRTGQPSSQHLWTRP